MKIARVFFNVDMRCNFEGIRLHIKKEKMEIDELKKDMVVILLNSRQNCFKLLIDDTYIVYYKHKGRIPLDALQFLPQRFGGSEMEFNRAVESSLRQKLKIGPAPEEKNAVKVIRRPKAHAPEARA